MYDAQLNLGTDPEKRDNISWLALEKYSFMLAVLFAFVAGMYSLVQHKLCYYMQKKFNL